MKNIILTILTAYVLFTFTGCMKDDIIIDPDRLTTIDRPLNFAAPIGTVRIYAEDLMGRLGDSTKNFILIDDDGLLNAKYSDSIDIAWDDIVKLESVSVNKNYPFIIPPGSTGLNEQITFQEKIKLNKNADQRFDSLYIQSSTLSLDVQFPNQLSGQVHLTFPGISIDGQVLEITYDSETSNPHTERDLEGHHVIFDHGVDSSYILMEISPENIQAPDNLGGAYNFNVSLSLSETVPEVTFGFFGNSTVYDQDASMDYTLLYDLRMFEMVQFYDIMLNLDFDNYYGIDYECVLNDVSISSSQTLDTLDIELTPNILHVDPAEYNKDIIPKRNTINFNNTNSNIHEAITILPDRMDYHLQVNTNPGMTDGNNFVTQQNKISGKIDVIIPMWLKCSNYTREDTIQNFDINNMFKGDSLEYFDSVILRLVVTNSFPFDLNMQAFPVDSNFVKVDSLFESQQAILVSGTLDANDKIVEAGVSEKIDIVLSKDQIKAYKDANVKKLLLKTKTTTAEDGNRFVKIFEDYGLEVKVTLKIVSSEL